MSWLLNLYKTYELNLDQVGKTSPKYNGHEYTLLPISHTTQTAHLEVYITEEGNFHSANLTDKSDANTVIPCTEDSASRAGSKIAPYPLHDKLIYVAGDFVKYGGKIKKEEPYSYYINQLKEWANSPFSVSKIKSIYIYLSKRKLIEDLINVGILHTDSKGNLINQWDKEAERHLIEKPPIFSRVTGDLDSTFIRFTVRSTNKVLSPIWKDPIVYESFIQFYDNMSGKSDYCYVTGKEMPSTSKHANKN